MIVLTDLNGTLTTGSPVVGLAKWVGQRQSRLRSRLYLASTMGSYLLARRGWIDWTGWVERLMVSALPLIKDATPALLGEMAEWTVENELWPKRRPDVLARLEAHRLAGDRIILVSSVYQPTAAAFAGRIGAEAIATAVTCEHGKARLSGQLVAGPGKMDQVKARLGVDRVDFAYGDTVSDIPMLSFAGYGVAVYPDPGLRRAAQANGWEILE